MKTKYSVNKPHINPYNPRYNLSPGQKMVSIINDGSTNRAGELNWGFLPPWSKEIKSGYQMMNARAETIKEKPSFKASFESKRCVLLADSYYEWRTTGGEKVPFRIQVQGQPLIQIAGLYSTCTLLDGTKHHSCAVITTDANELIASIHHRMPAILSDEDLINWLNPNNHSLNDLSSYLKPYAPHQMTMYEVSTLMNNARIDTPECIAPKR